MSYTIKYYEQAIADAKKLQRDEPAAFKKLQKLEQELKNHPQNWHRQTPDFDTHFLTKL